jgi:hypothetical protein
MKPDVVIFVPVLILFGLIFVLWPAGVVRFQVMFWVRGGEINSFAIAWVRFMGVVFLGIALVLAITSLMAALS